MSDDIVYLKLDATGRTRAQILARIAQVDALLDSLFTTALTSVGNGNIMQYKLDTGQTKTDVMYSTVSQVEAGISKYEDLRQRYVNMLTPRMVRLVPGRNFRNR